jgi:uncharacterized protein YodC (DUF2158 family)
MKIGDVVRLKSGGPAMVVGKLGPEGAFECLYYFPGDGLVKGGMFPEHVLEPLEKTGTARKKTATRRRSKP